MVKLVKQNSSEAWGYTLINSTIDNLIRHFEGQNSIRLYPDFRERKERAQELLFECVGKKPVLFYIRRQGKGKDKGEEIWDLTIATDNSDFSLPKRLKEIQKTLEAIFGVFGQVFSSSFVSFTCGYHRSVEKAYFEGEKVLLN